MKEFLKVCKYLLETNQRVMTNARLQGIRLMDPIVVLSVLAAFLYVCSPIDLIAESMFSPIIAYIDDTIVAIAALTYLVRDLVQLSATGHKSDEEPPNPEEVEEDTGEVQS